MAVAAPVAVAAGGLPTVAVRVAVLRGRMRSVHQENDEKDGDSQNTCKDC